MRGWPCSPRSPASGPRRMRRWAAAHPLPDRSLELLAWQNLVGAWPISAERMSGYLTQGGEGGQARHEPRRAGARGRRGDRRVARAGPRRHRAGGRDRGVRRPHRRAGPARTRWGRSCCRSPVPGSPTSTRARSCSSTRWSIRTTAGPSTGRPAASCWPASTTAGCRRSTPRGRRSCWSRPARCGCAATAPRCSPATERCRRKARPPGTPSRSHARRRSWRSRRGCRSGLAARGGWRDTVLPLPEGTTDWHDVITDAPVDGAAPRLSDVLSRYPVALLVRPA